MRKPRKPASVYTRSHDRTMTIAEIAELPALMTTEDFARLYGCSRIHAAKLCQEGRLPATRVGRSWLINTEKTLEKLGLN